MVRRQRRAAYFSSIGSDSLPAHVLASCHNQATTIHVVLIPLTLMRHPMRKFYAFVVVFTAGILCANAQAQSTFDHSTGNHFWNVATNWTPDGVPDAPGAATIIPAPNTTLGGSLTIDLGEDITIGSLEIQKPVSPNSGNTTITGSNTLTISGGTASITNKASTAGTGATTIAVPVAIATTLTITQESNDLLSFNGAISGGSGLSIIRPAAPAAARTVVLGAANSYGGTTTINGNGSGNDILYVRLGDANAIPSGSTIAASNSVVFELAAGNFARTIGAGAGQFQFSGGRNGWGAIGGDRQITLNGGASINWGAATWNQLILGTSASTGTAELTNPIVLNTTNNRTLRTFNGSAAIDGQLSGALSGPGTLTKQESGVLSLSGSNSNTGPIVVEAGMLRLDHVNALGTGNLQIGSGATIGLGAANFARQLGTAAGQVQLVAIGGGNNQANAGFSAHGANRSVTLTNISAGAELTWGADLFLSGGTDPASRNLILSDDTSDATLTFTNPIDLGAGNQNPSVGDIVTRAVVVRNGSADIDAVMSGALDGTSSLTKDNSGTLALTANNTYSGGTNVLAGRLLVNNTPVNVGDSGTGTGDVTLSGTATLGGTGAIAGTVITGAGTTVAPGVSGIESIDVGGLSINSGSLLNFDLAAPGTSDLINVTDTDGLTIDGVGAVNLFDAGGLAVGNYTLIDYAGTIQGSGVAAFLGQTPTGPAGFIYSLFDTGSTIDLAVLAAPGNDADFNDDGIIDAADYVVWRKFNGATGTGTDQTGDANGDGDVNDLDYDEWFENFGTSPVPPPPGNGGAVPEPATFILVGIAAMITSAMKVRRIR
jgi:autotransporter-associated beta strand protein